MKKHLSQFKESCPLFEEGGKTFCLRTNRSKFCYKTPADAWNKADCIYDKDDVILFVYQCLPYYTWYGDGFRFKVTKHAGCRYYHLTKQTPIFGGAYRIGHMFPAQTRDEVISSMPLKGMCYPQTIYPPAPLK